MRKILFLLAMLISINLYSQVDSVNVEHLEKERRNHIMYGAFEGTLGIFGLFVGIRHITYRDKMSTLDYVGAILYGGSGSVFSGMAIKDFREARKIKKKLEELENESTN